jgi:hypothetical protein
LPLAVGTHGGAPNRPGRAKGRPLPGRRAGARPHERARRFTNRKQSYALRSGHGDGGIPGRAPATAAAHGGLAHAIHDLVLGYWPAASAQPKLRAPTASNTFESAGCKRRAAATAAIIQRLIGGQAARPDIARAEPGVGVRSKGQKTMCDRNRSPALLPLRHQAATGPAVALPPITRNFALWALIRDSHYVVNYKK